MGMVDVGNKPVVSRLAKAEGTIRLSSHTTDKIREGRIKKGDPLLVAEVAAMNAVKQTHVLIPHCHQILLNQIELGFDVSDSSVTARCTVRSRSRTGVEMEALIGVTIALDVIWDMVKYLEKDDRGQYPSTTITDIRVIRKTKTDIPDPD